MAAWWRSGKRDGLQNRYSGVRSPPKPQNCRGGGIGLRRRLKISGPKGLVGSNPTRGTTLEKITKN